MNPLVRPLTAASVIASISIEMVAVPWPVLVMVRLSLLFQNASEPFSKGILRTNSVDSMSKILTNLSVDTTASRRWLGLMASPRMLPSASPVSLVSSNVPRSSR